MDETPVKTMRIDNTKIKNGKKTWMWVYRNRPSRFGHPIVLFDWQSSRRSDHPREFLKDFSGVLLQMAIRFIKRLPGNGRTLRSRVAGFTQGDTMQTLLNPLGCLLPKEQSPKKPMT